VFGFEKELRECRMGQIVSGWRKHDFGVACDVELMRSRTVIDQRHTPDLDVVFRRDDDFETGGDVAVTAMERGLLRSKLDPVIVGHLRRGLMCRGPHDAAAHVTQVDSEAAWIARR